MGGGGGGRAVDNGWEGDIRFCRLYGVKLDSKLPPNAIGQTARGGHVGCGIYRVEGA